MASSFAGEHLPGDEREAFEVTPAPGEGVDVGAADAEQVQNGQVNLINGACSDYCAPAVSNSNIDVFLVPLLRFYIDDLKIALKLRISV
jgi:hypothetical protein